MAEETSGPDRDWESELSGEVDRDEDECKDGERGREPGMVTGAEPASDLGPVSPRSCSSKSLSKDAMFMSLRRRSKAEPGKEGGRMLVPKRREMTTHNLVLG